MLQKEHKIVSTELIVEFLILNLSIGLISYFKNYSAILENGIKEPLTHIFFLALIFNIVWGGIVLFVRDTSYYNSGRLVSRAKDLLYNTFIFIGIISTIAILTKFEYFNRTTLHLPIFLFALLKVVFLYPFVEVFKRRNNKSEGKNILVVGIGEKWKEVKDFASKLTEVGYNVVGYLDDKEEQTTKEFCTLGKIFDLPIVLETMQVDELFLTASSLDGKAIKKIVQNSDYYGVRLSLIPETSFFPGSNFKTYNVDGLPVLKHRQSPLDVFRNQLYKRLFDVVFSLAVLVVLSPVYLLIAILIKLDSKGPVFYKPVRKGEGGEKFECYKFRTMSVCDDPKKGARSTVKNDPRITRIGRYLRKLDLDELPQFLNVFKGEMSVVGPRPHRVNLAKDFRKTVHDYMVRHYVKPGITGWAQVNGWRGPTETPKQKKNRIQHDLWYIENWRFLWDIKIIFLTVFSRKTRKNAF